MSNIRKLLTGLLVLQLVAGIGIYWSGQSVSKGTQQYPLFNFTKDQADRLLIADVDKATELKKNEQGWELSNLSGLPADKAKLELLMSKLTSLTTNWPVTTTQSSHERFDVSETKFQRRVEVFRGSEMLGKLFIGTSPGFRKVHVRRDGDDEVYALELNTYDVPTQNKDWLDKQLLASSDIHAIEGLDYRLKKDSDNWVFDDIESGAVGTTDSLVGSDSFEINEDKVNQLLSNLNSLRVRDLADEDVDPESAKSNETELRQLKVSSGDATLDYQFIKKDDNYYVRRNDFKQLFAINKSDYDNVANMNRKAFTQVIDTGDEESKKENAEEGLDS